MKDYILRYRAFFAEQLAQGEHLDKLLEFHEKQITYISHERLVHLFIMLFFAAATLGAILITVLVQPGLAMLALDVLLLCLLVPYIAHYYFLENQTQALYRDYNALYAKLHGTAFDFTPPKGTKA